MPSIKLSPTREHLAQEYLLVPAWKKAHDFVRYHNWYSDVLELDLTNANISAVVRDIAKEVSSRDPLQSTPVRLVLAPKTQEWHIKNDKWLPVGGPQAVETRLRPLAHVSARDQIIGTAFMILLANIVESRQGDPRMSPMKARRHKVVSYGHRLFCDRHRSRLKFRWGNAGVYRKYFQDYQSFVVRPEQIVAAEFGVTDLNWAIVSADLSQFYDRVRPDLLHNKVKRLRRRWPDREFLNLFRSFFDWSWHTSDQDDALKYAAKAEPTPIDGFDRVALPQGLVASGFFSNLVLLDFDEAVVDLFGKWNEGNEWQILDYCRYVDDMRFVLRLAPRLASLKKSSLEALLTETVTDVLTEKLKTHAPGLVVNPGKCGVLLGRNAAAGSIRVSSSMRRINQNASGVMDMFVGEETLELIETLLYSSESSPLGFKDRFQDTVLAAQPDVRPDTIARFAAYRFRETYRTLRPMSEVTDGQNAMELEEEDDVADEWNTAAFDLRASLTRESLDQKLVHFAGRLVERWIRDPSNVRLLRVALDLKPDARTLNAILELLNEYLRPKKRGNAPRRVACYCAAELLKAGATETGLVDDEDKLPDGVDLIEYHTRLSEFANEVVRRSVLSVSCATNFVEFSGGGWRMLSVTIACR